MFEPIRLYQIPWSHFCDKVRWALDLKNLPIERITFNTSGPTPGLERAPKTLTILTPIIEDPNNKEESPFFLSDSTPILLYLDSYYPPPSLFFPSQDKQTVIELCLRLDSELGPYARRLIYVQILGEHPRVLCLTQGVKYPWAYNPNDLRSRFVARFVACFLIARFRLHRIREDRIREKTEALLLEFVERLKNKNYLIGEQFTAADLTFCSLFRPLELIPYYRNDERFASLFKYHQDVRQNHDLKFEENVNLVEKFLTEHREEMKNPGVCWKIGRFFRKINFIRHCFFWMMCAIVSKVYGPSSDEDQPAQFTPKDQSATNDQRNLNIRSKLGIMPFIIKYTCHRLFTMPGQVAYLYGDRPA